MNLKRLALRLWRYFTLISLFVVYFSLVLVQAAIKELLNADRASIFLTDNQKQELHARVFSVSDEESNSVSTVHLEQNSSAALSHLDSFVANLGKKPIEIVSYKGRRVRYVKEFISTT